MGLRLLGIMIGIICLVLVISILGALIGLNLTFLGALIPIGLFVFIIFKFKKEGLVAILLFLGGLMIMGSASLFYLGKISDQILYVMLVIGIMLSAIGYVLGKVWKVKL